MAASSLSVSSLVALLLLLLVAVSSGEEDFAFESSPAEEDASTAAASSSSAAAAARHVRRHWGIPDVMVVAGKLLHVRVPADAFSGAVDHYEAEGSPSKALPSWLLFDKASGLFEGVPGVGDVGENYVIVKAVGAGPHNAAKDVFSVEVLRDAGLAADSVVVVVQPTEERCEQGEDLTFLTVLLDARFEHLLPKQRVAAIKNLAGFLSLHHSLFHLEPHSAKEDLLSDQVVLAGPGNVKKRSSKHTTAVRWQVGCEGRLWKHHADFVHQLRQQAQDGTLAEVLQQPIVGWHVKTEASDAHRERRETGSGDFDDEDDVRMILFNNNSDNVEETDTVPEARIVPTMASPVFPEATSHPHRHHHGEDLAGVDLESSLAPTSTQAFNLPPVSPILSNPLMHTPTLVPVRPTRLMSMDVIQPSRVYDIDAAAPSATPVFVTEVEPSVTPEYGSTQVTDPLPNSNVTGVNDTILSSTGSTGSSSTSQSSTPEEEEEAAVTTPALPRATTERAPTDETTEYGVKNFPPSINKRLGKFPLTAGKAFRYHIPENTFTDLEEGNTRNLRLIFKTPEGTSVNYKYWAQFNPETQEVYALPLDENVSKWKFIVEALDKEGKSVSDYLELSVQHHKSRRTVNHEFSLHLHVEKNYDYPSVVDWELEVLDALVKLYGDADANQITVRSVNVMEPVIFTWTNDTLPKTLCPKDDIDRLYKVLVSDESGKPSAKLRDKLGPKLKVTRVTYQGIGQCSKPAKPELAAPPPRKPQENFPPTPRNQVDHIRARVGELLVFIVPEDSFYDPEDGSVRNMKLSLMMMDRSPVPPNHWLQFDVKNQEFYGVPLPGEEGREEYQLVCEDKEGLKAHDSLVVEVYPARKLPYSVEFSMNVDTPYSRFRHSAHTKRHFVEKVLELFGDRNVTSVTVSGVQEQRDDDGGAAGTVVTWHNQSLAVTSCPRIDALRRVLVADDESISERVNRVLGPDFSVTHIRLVPAGVCLGSFTVIHSSSNDGAGGAGGGGGGVDETPVGGGPGGDLVGGGDDDYLVTFVVPAVVIVAMLLLAGVVACVLYRRRRRGKMSVGDDDDDARQSFRNRGIPVIFQDELEERPEPDNKSPVIMKDEKPPLPPPEYQQHGDGGDVTAATPCLAPAPAAPVPVPPSAAHPLLQNDDAPYQPPPPFTSGRESARQNRPKPTPTYRKPPPYVPP